ncbi:MAG: polyphosphate polymerase domain-containing protein, partial [Oscillospiraceae bacterium]|nr:polyphosphate polymerase domain-containing protein [Oscillospiraceae bacterium]
RASIEKPPYKEKLRLRSYGLASADSPVFIELKKKYNGIVYKRRAQMSYAEAYDYLKNNRMPHGKDQILNEIEYFRSFYKPRAVMNISYVREAFYDREDSSLRLTFDKDVLWRTSNLDLSSGAFGNALLEDNMRLMELKTAGAIPIWLCRALDKAKVYPTSFSKYGNAYKSMISDERVIEEVFHCA